MCVACLRASFLLLCPPSSLAPGLASAAWFNPPRAPGVAPYFRSRCQASFKQMAWVRSGWGLRCSFRVRLGCPEVRMGSCSTLGIRQWTLFCYSKSAFSDCTGTLWAPEVSGYPFTVNITHLFPRELKNKSFYIVLLLTPCQSGTGKKISIVTRHGLIIAQLTRGVNLLLITSAAF